MLQDREGTVALGEKGIAKIKLDDLLDAVVRLTSDACTIESLGEYLCIRHVAVSEN